MQAYISALVISFYSQLWIVAPHPPLEMDLLEHPSPQPTKGQWPTPVSVGMKSPMESPQQWLPVWLMGCGDLYQLVHVCEVDTVTDNSYCIDCVLTHSVVDCGPPSIIGNGSPGTPTSTTLGGMVTYTCDTGYDISNGATMATCMANGMWEPVLTCSRKSYNCSCHQFHVFSQLLTVVPWTSPPMEQWTHSLEPPSWWMLPTPVTLDTTLLDQTLELVRQTKYGLQIPPSVNVSSMSDCVHCIHCVHIPQLLTVVSSLFLTGKLVHPLEPPSWTLPPTPVMMDIISMEYQIEPVELMEAGT